MKGVTVPLVSQAGSHRKLRFHEAPGPQPRQFFLYTPTTLQRGAPLVISVHGIARNAPAHAYRLMEQAERFGLALVAPFFEKRHYGQYQQLSDEECGARADLALIDIAEAAAALTGADASQLLLFGFSGGAQFAHRFVLAHPRRALGAVLAAAGWYTFPSHDVPYPYGLASPPSNLTLDLVGALATPQHVLVGEFDTDRDHSLRRDAFLDRQQGRTRVARAGRWCEAMRAASTHANSAAFDLTMLPGVAHSFVAATEHAALADLIFASFSKYANLKPLSGL